MAEAPRLLVVTLSNIGDVVLTTPVFEALAARYAESRIDIFADARSAELLAAAPYAGDIYLYNKRSTWSQRLAFLRTLRARRYRLIVDLRSHFLANLLRADQRLYKPRHRDPDLHAAQEHYAALAPLEPATPTPACRLHLSTDDHARAAQLLSPLPGQRWLAIAPGANWPGKKWPREAYRALLTLAASRFDAAIILGSHHDDEDARAIARATLPCLITTGRTDLRTAAAMISRAQAFVGNDSGLGHVAAALGVPTVTPFGPGDPKRYRPWGERTCVVQAPKNDLTLLHAEQVWSALEDLLVATTGPC
jgi:ADP-heptose:LPS heptosyltransferase